MGVKKGRKGGTREVAVNRVKEEGGREDETQGE